jgi:hypothetical protein
MKSKLNRRIFTVCNVAYLDKVMALADSLFDNDGIKLDVYIFDGKRKLNSNNRICNIIWMEDLNIPDFKIMAFKYTVIELTTSLKPLIAEIILKESSKVIFLDPDTYIFNSIQSVFDDLDRHPVVLTPHYYTPKITGGIDDERLLRFGFYNLGFFAVNDSPESKKFLKWWSSRCLENAFDDAQFGVFTDQKWVSIAPSFFNFIHSSTNPGLNVAYWNIEERIISEGNLKKYLVNNQVPLILFHFSSYNKKIPHKLSKIDINIGQNSASILNEICLSYGAKLSKYEELCQDKKYFYDYMSNGDYISPTLRRAYASIVKELPKDCDPFDSNGPIAVFARKNNLVQLNNKPFILQGYNNIKEHSVKIKIVYSLMRVALKILGPNRYMNFSKLLVYLSSYQRNRDMWKFK